MLNDKQIPIHIPTIVSHIGSMPSMPVHWSCSALLWCSSSQDSASLVGPLQCPTGGSARDASFSSCFPAQGLGLKHLCQSSAVQYGYRITSATGSDTLSKVAWFGSQGLSALK